VLYIVCVYTRTHQGAKRLGQGSGRAK